MVTKRPQWLRCMWGMTPRASATTLRKLRSTALRHSSIEMERKFLGGGPPALATQISIRPKVLATAAMNFSMVSTCVTSTAWARTCTPCRERISSAAASSFFSVRANMATLAPSAANASAVERPIPSLDPPTMATLFFRVSSIPYLCSRDLALLITLLVEDRDAWWRCHLDVVFLEALLDHATQLPADRKMLPGTRLHQHQVNHFVSRDPFDPGHLRLSDNSLSETR